jgi:hypothetical protein
MLSGRHPLFSEGAAGTRRGRGFQVPVGQPAAQVLGAQPVPHQALSHDLEQEAPVEAFLLDLLGDLSEVDVEWT